MLYLRRSVLAVIIIVSLLAGFASGFGGGYYKYVYAPQKKAQEVAKKQQEELNKMVRRGEVVSVEPDKLTVKVEKGGGDIGKAITVRTNEYTSVQVGMNFVSEPDKKTDLTQWFKAGDYVDMLVKDGQVLALHRELRPGEQEPRSPQGPAGPPPQEQVQEQRTPQQEQKR